MTSRLAAIVLLSALICLFASASSAGMLPDSPSFPPPGSPGPPDTVLVDARGPRRDPSSSGPSVPGTGFLFPSIDLSHFRVDRLPAGLTAADLPSRYDWRESGIITPVQDQGTCGACYAFAFLGSFESKLQIDRWGTFDFSENHAKECNWEEANDYRVGGNPVGSCDGGNFYMMTSLYSQQGTVLEACDAFVASDVGCTTGCSPQKTLLGWRYASGEDVPDPNVLKGYIQTYGPLATTMYVGKYNYEAWRQEFSSYDGSYTLYYTGSQTPNHAVLIVGWDDNLPHGGGAGAWIVKNSWGTDWGGTSGYGSERGYFTIAYGSARIGGVAGFVSQWKNADASGGLLLYDEAGFTDSIGWMGSKTDWGLCSYTVPQATTVTNVEFWTTDATSDVDVYLYDSFDGARLGNQLHSITNLSYDEMGYFSVSVNPPLQVSAGSQVVAVVKFTNVNSNYPVAMDDRSSYQSQRTYHSSNGTDGSWSDVGSRWEADVAIRLRTSGTAVTPTPTRTATRTHTPTITHTPTRTLTPSPSPTFKPITPVAWSWLPAILKNATWAAAPTPSPTRTGTSIPSATPTPTLTGSVSPTATPTLPSASTGVFPLSGKPYSLSVNPANGWVYIARKDSQDLAVLNLYSLAQVAAAPLPKGPQTVRVDPTLGQAYASYGDPLYIVSCATNAVVGQMAKGAYASSELAVNPTNHRVYVGDWTTVQGRQDQVQVYDGYTYALIRSVDLGISGVVEDISVAVNPNTGLAYAAYTGDQRIAVIGLDSQISMHIVPSSMASLYDPWMAINASTSRLYMRGESQTVVINLNSNTQVGTLDQAGLIAVDSVRNRVYVQRTTKIYVYDGATNAKLHEIVLDKHRYVTDIACDPPTRRLLLAAPNDNEIVVVRDP